MQETIANLLKSVEGTLLVIIIVVGCMNVVTTAVIKLLLRFKDKTATQLDNKIYALLVPVAGLIAKVLEFCSANSTALPPRVREELQRNPVEKPPVEPAPAPVAEPALGANPQGE